MSRSTRARRGVATRSVISILTALAVVVGTVEVASATPPAGSEAVEPRETPVPGLESSEPNTKAGALPEGDFSDPPEPQVPLPPDPQAGRPAPTPEATRFVEGESKLVDRTEYSDIFENPDGTRTERLSGSPVNVEIEDGEWVPIETEVADDPRIGGRVDRHSLRPRFARNADAGTLVSVRRNGVTVAFSLEGASNARARRNGSTVTYPNALPGIDLQYLVDTGEVKEQLVLHRAPRGAQTWRFPMTVTGGEPVLGDDGQIIVSDRSGTEQVVIPAPVMWDSSGVAGQQEPAEAMVDVELIKDADGWVVELSPDKAWLSDPARVYPVIVDPPLRTASGIQETRAYKSDGYSCINCGIRAGNSRSSGRDSYYRTLVKFNYDIGGRQVLDVFADVRVDSGSNSWEHTWVNHATQFNYHSIGEELAYFGSGPPGNWAQANDDRLTARFAQWVRDWQLGGWLVIRGAEAPGWYTYKTYSIWMYIDYNERPSVSAYPAPPAPADGGTTGTMPVLAATGHDPNNDAMQYYFRVATGADGETGVVYNSGWQNANYVTVPATANLRSGVRYYWRAYVKDSYDGWWGTGTVVPGPVRSFVTNTPPPAVDAATAVPQDKAVVATTTPTLSTAQVMNPQAGETTRYWFRLATGSDARTGSVLNSGWLTTPTWTPPAGSLQDGVTYTWTVLTDDGISTTTPTWVRSLRVALRIGDAGPAPTEAVGPVMVNLANGNASLSFGSPQIPTVAGPMGLTFAYNSQTPTKRGLTGRYYDETGLSDIGGPDWKIGAGQEPVMVRTDPAVAFDWGLGSPGPAVPMDRFLVQWTGFLTPPTGVSLAGWKFGVTQDDGARVWVNNTLVLDRWSDQAGGPNYGNAVNLTAAANPLKVEYYENGGGSSLSLWAQPPTGAAFMVPADWLTTTPETLPAGWTASAALAGNVGQYASADVKEGSVVLTDLSGSAHTYTRTSVGGYTAPEGEYGTLALDGKGQVTLLDEDGQTYVFGASGRLESVTSLTDQQKRAAHRYTHAGSSAKVTQVEDPVSGRVMTLKYGGDAACPVAPAGLSAAPAGLLCAINYPDGTSTRLFYTGSDVMTAQLARIVDPGTEVTDFAYNAAGRMTRIRDAMANDWLAADASRSTEAPVATEIAYAAGGRVEAVTLPAPDGQAGTPRPGRSIAYAASGETGGTTHVDVAGLDASGGPNGHFRTVTYDASLRQLTSTDATGVTTGSEWNHKDQPLSTTDGAGRKSTTIYNDRDLVTDTYGPAPASCFGADRRPTSACAATVPHTSKTYTGPTGQPAGPFRAQFWANPTLSGPPTLTHQDIEVEHGRGVIQWNWGDSSPWYAAATPQTPIDNWSGRFTGLLTLDKVGAYQFRFYSDDGVRLWIDDTLVVDSWQPGAAQPRGPATFANAAEAGSATVPAKRTHSFRVDYQELSGAASIDFQWLPPGGSTWETVPSSFLSSDIELVTSTTEHDSAPAAPSVRTATVYNAPGEFGGHLTGLPRATIVDPGGLALATGARHNVYQQRSSWTLPAQRYDSEHAEVQTASTYWGDREGLPAATCGVPAGTPQGGALKTNVGPVNSEGKRLVWEYVYDASGRAAGLKRGSEGWTCTSYDARGRATKVEHPAFGGTAARTVTHDHAVGGDPLVSSVTDAVGTITAQVDLLGRGVVYTDVWGTTTTTSYDQAGRQTSSTTTLTGAVQSTLGWTYDLAGRPLTTQRDGLTLAVTSYGAAGEITSVSYPSGAGKAGNGSSLVATDRDGAGAVTGLEWAFPEGQASVSEALIRSQEGKVLSSVVTDGATTAMSSYTYDAAGRLVAASIPRHTLTYDYTDTTACGGVAGAVAQAGKNSNRMRATDSLDGGPARSTTYCYDAADRLIATMTAGATPDTNPVIATDLTTAGGTAATLAYDGHGNTTRLADQVLAYDSADRHTSTTLTDGTEVTYGRDATDRIVSRTHRRAGASTATTTRYSYTSDGDTPEVVLDENNTLLERVHALPGGVVLTDATSAADTWAYPNLHGDVMVTADSEGNRSSGPLIYEPFGQVADAGTGGIGTGAADDGAAMTRTDDLAIAWLGQHQRPYESVGSIATIQMGARQYVPALGRFIEVDPVEGGSASDYDYTNADPVNATDLDGRCPMCLPAIIILARVAAQAAARGAPRVAARAGGAGPVRAGQQGLSRAGVIQSNTRIVVNGRTRIPDILNRAGRVIGEVKNVNYQAYTQQLRDYVAYAQRNNFRFELHVRGGSNPTKLSGPLQAAVNSGLIRLVRF
ncbi:PA14 domain-containing protein [Blastococcus deserti]|uniref:PA14 domain-containing protein n=1 Tax=Blastococcus deserti TaxID=2259033 RepID=A0ABW4X4L7_9ACTN